MLRALGEGAHGVQRVGRAQRHLDARKTSFTSASARGGTSVTDSMTTTGTSRQVPRSVLVVFTGLSHQPFRVALTGVEWTPEQGSDVTSPEPPGQLEDFDSGRRFRQAHEVREEPRQVQQGGSRASGEVQSTASHDELRYKTASSMAKDADRGPTMQVTQAASTCTSHGGRPAARRARTVGTSRTGSFWEPSPAILAVV